MTLFLALPLSSILFVLASASNEWRRDSLHHEYSYIHHPLKTRTLFSAYQDKIRPVVMRKYYLEDKHVGRYSAQAGVFTPGAASYVFRDSAEQFVKDADVFSFWIFHPSSRSDPRKFGRVYLNYRARVFAIIDSHWYFSRDPPAGFQPNITGVDNGWNVLGVVQSPTGAVHLGNQGRNDWCRLPGIALAVEIPVSVDESGNYIVEFPHPWSIYMNHARVRSFGLVFTQAEDGDDVDIGHGARSFGYFRSLFSAMRTQNSSSSQLSRTVTNLTSFPPPTLPQSFQYDMPDGEPGNTTVDPQADPPTANQPCPTWLHDIYVTKSRYPEDTAHNEPTYWRTWHPAVDPIYWCYFDHEHGSWPGLHYQPLFRYVAHKTPDNSTVHQRQEESHEGFKVYYIPFIGDDQVVIITLHAHISRAKRFTERHHTLTFAVLRGSTVEMEISFKADFGPGIVRYNWGNPQPMDEEQASISRDVISGGHRASRLFNVINIDENYPESLDPRFRIKGDISKGPGAILGGFYEQWQTTFPSCLSPIDVHHASITFDVRDPSTAARFPTGTTDENIQLMHGFGLKRIILVQGGQKNMSLTYCAENIRNAVNSSIDGTFFTDRYFQSEVTGPGNYSVRQFISKNFSGAILKPGLLRAADPWTGWYGYGSRPGLQNVEGAVLKTEN